MSDAASLNVYEVDDGETHWILAENPEDATECFYATYCSKTQERADFELAEPTVADQDTVTIIRDPGASPEKITLRQAAAEHLAGKYPSVPCVLASTVY